MSSSEQVIGWFEQVCNKLPTDPVAATNSLTEFRNSDQALPIAITFLVHINNLSPISQFQAVSIIQFCLLKNWSSICQNTREEIKRSLNKALISGLSTFSGFIIGKLIQTIVLTWKLCWISSQAAISASEASERANLYTDIKSLLITDICASKYGYIFIRELIEEFSVARKGAKDSQSSSTATVGFGLPLSAHNEAFAAFEEEGVDQLYSITLDSIRRLMIAIINDPSVVIMAVDTLSEAFKALNEILHWNFQGKHQNISGFVRSEKLDEEKLLGRQELRLPAAWVDVWINTDIMAHVFGCYDILVSLVDKVQVSPNQASPPTVHDCASNCRLLVTSLAAVNCPTDSIHSNQLGNMLCTQFLPRLQVSLSRVDIQQQQALSGVLKAEDSFVATELQQFSLLILQLFDNFAINTLSRLPCFELLLTSSTQALVLSSQLISRAAQCLISASTNGSARPTAPNGLVLFVGGSVCVSGGDLLEGWCGESVKSLLSALIIISNDPILVSPKVDEVEQEEKLIRNMILSNMRSFVTAIFSSVFQALHASAICNLFADVADEDEDEATEALADAAIQEFISNTCSLCRLCAFDSLSFILTQLNGCNKAIGDLLANQNDLKIAERQYSSLLETQRVCLLFASHFCVEGFEPSAAYVCKTRSETPVIPALIILYSFGNSSSGDLFSSLISLLSEVSCALRHQLTASNMHRGASPMLVQMQFDFISDYMDRYAYPDYDLYGVESRFVCERLQQLHDGPSFLSMLEFWFQAGHYFLAAMPFEKALTLSTSRMVRSVARTTSGRSSSSISFSRALFQLPSIGAMLCLLIGQEKAPTAASRVSLEGLTSMFEALAELASRLDNIEALNQICSLLSQKCSSVLSGIAQHPGQQVDPHQMLILLQTAASIRGIARCNAKQSQKIVFEFVKCALPPLFAVLQFATAKSCDGDPFLREMLLLLKDFAETHIASLSLSVSRVLYEASLQSIYCLTHWFSRSWSTVSAEARDDEDSENQSDLVTIVLQLLNALATKDFLLDDEDNTEIVNSLTERTHVVQVGDVLIVGLQLLCKHLTVDLFRSYADTATKYFCFVSLTVGAFDANLAKHVREHQEGVQLLTVLVDHLIWAAGSYDGNTARMALQSINSIATYQYMQLATVSSNPSALVIGFGNARGDLANLATISEIFSQILMRLLQMLLLADSCCDYGISHDRVDAFANALFPIILLNPERFRQCVFTGVGQCPDHLRPFLLASFDKLMNGVDCTNLAKPNKLAFSRNFRAFMLAIGSHLTIR